MLSFFKGNKLKSQDFGYYQKITPPESVRKFVLDFISKDTDCTRLIDENQKITKTNWMRGHPDGPQYYQKRHKKLNKIFNKHFHKIFRDHFRQSIVLVDMWYQVYAKHSGGFHNFHDHAFERCPVSAIFYVKLHGKELLTQFKIGDSIVTPDAQEGDIIIFDSKIFHASPPNYTDHDKIVVSFNLNFKKS